MPHLHPVPTRLRPFLGASLLGLACALAHGQSLPSSSPPEKEESIIELSPFTVTANDDSGYQAGNTLAGSRLNTKLSETPASVSVFTEEFLRDLGATNLGQVLEYGVNANADFGAGTTAPSFAYLDGGLLNDVRVNNRGLSASRTMDFLGTVMPIDSYNTGRFDISSGPNSVLFGFGSAGGIVNASTRQADLRRTFANVNVTTGSWRALRTDADFNIVALRNRLSLRLMAVHDRADTWRRYAHSETNRWTGVIGFKPHPTTTVTALYERGDITAPTMRPYNRIDSLSFWWRQGRPVVDNTSFGSSTSAVQNAYGIRGTSIRHVYVPEDGRAIFARTGSPNTVLYESASIYETGMTSGIPTQRQETGTYQTLLPTSPREDGLPYSPYDINYYGPEAVRTNDIDRQFVRVEQKLGRDGYLELAYNHEYGAGLSNQLSGDFALYGDPNRYLPNPDGTPTRVPNPHAGELYVEHVWYHNKEYTRNEVARATASWRLDLGRWGDHRLAGLVERSVNDYRTSQGSEILVDSVTKAPIYNATPENFSNSLFRRRYVTEGAPETYLPGSRFDTRPISYGGRTYEGRLIYNANVNGARRTIDSFMAATQSRFWRGRFIVTGGVRRDEVEIVPYAIGRLTASDPLVQSGERLVNEYMLQGDDTANIRKYSFDTYTAGAVLGLTPWLRAFYNESNNNGAPATNRRMLPDATIPPPPEGKGRDAGLMFSFLDGRYFARATAFQTSSVNDPSVRDNAFIGAHRRIVNAIRDAGYLTQAEADARNIPLYLGDFMSDMDTRGYEFELKANPTPNLSLTASFSYTKIERSNLGNDWYPWFAEQKAFYSKYPSTLLTTTNVPIFTEIAQIETGVENLFALNRIGYNNRPYKANGFARYSFDSGPLKGVFVGGGVRWQDKNVLQRDIVGFDALGKDILGKILYGPEIFNVDALVGYSTRLNSSLFGRGTTLRAQLNVANVLDNDDVQVIRLNRVGDGYWRVVPREPRSFRLTVSLGF